MKTTTLLQSLGATKVRFAGYFTKGLGDVASDELIAIVPGAVIIELSERYFIGACSASALDAARDYLRTIDDLRLLVAGPTRVLDAHAFATLCSVAAKETRRFVEDDPDRVGASWSVTVSARTPIWREKMPWDPARIISTSLNGADTQARSRSAVDLRLQVEGDTMHLSLNIWDRPLGKRAEKPPQRLGALRPTVAAALLRLAVTNIDPAILNDGVYDPFCGTGTIVAEAREAGLQVYASDIDPAAVAICRDRLLQQATPPSGAPNETERQTLERKIFLHDARQGFPQGVMARILVANLPWGKQVQIARRSDLLKGVATMIARVVRKGGSCALLTAHEKELLSHLRAIANDVHVEVRHIGLLGQSPAVVLVRQEPRI